MSNFEDELKKNPVTTAAVPLDELPLSNLHKKVFFCCCGCPLLDGYVIGMIAMSLAIMSTQMPMDATMLGLVGMGTVAGMFFGSFSGGYITDKIGRKKMYFLCFLYIVVLSVLQFFIASPMQAFILRFLLGIGVGANYPIAGPYITEFSPKKYRGSIVGMLNAFWYAGYASSFVIGYFLLGLGNEISWRWMLASSAIPGIIWLVIGLNMPESPYWLVSKGKIKEANDVLKLLGDNVTLPEQEKQEGSASFMDIFRNGYGKWTFFCVGFTSLLVLPLYGIGTFTPTIMEGLGFADGNMQYLGAAIMNVFYLLGLIPVYFLVESWGRRPTLMWPFLGAAIALWILAATTGMNMSFVFILVVFIIYGAFTVATGAHFWIYPNELFPTHVRATAMGFITSMNRIAATVGTFIFPTIMANYGLKATLYSCGAVFFLGFVLCALMAPETKNLNLAEAASLNKSKVAR